MNSLWDLLNEDVKEYIFSFNKNYYEEKIKKYQEQKIKVYEWRKKKRECECGCLISNKKFYLHKKSKKHLKLMNEKI